MDVIAERNRGIKKALTIEEIFWKDKEERRRYEARQKFRRDEIFMVAGAEAQGRAEGEKDCLLKVARNMVLDDVAVDDISRFTGLSLTEIAELKKEIQR